MGAANDAGGFLLQLQRHRADRWLGIGMLILAAGLAINTLLGPLFTAVIEYPFTETVYNETLGLEAVSLALIAPLAVIAGVLVLRGHGAGPILAIGPAAYAAYMLVQYVVGPQYATYQPSIALHIGLLILSAALLVRAWSAGDHASLPAVSRGWAVVVFLLAGFVLSRWTGVFTGMAGAEPVPAAAADITMYWSIFLLDIGFIVPAALATMVGLLAGSRWATKALFGVIGWFALVPPSVTAMSIVKLLRDDPNGSTGDTAVFVVVTAIFWSVAVVLYRRLFAAHAGALLAAHNQRKPVSAAIR
jgi:hypothetical protein